MNDANWSYLYRTDSCCRFPQLIFQGEDSPFSNKADLISLAWHLLRFKCFWSFSFPRSSIRLVLQSNKFPVVRDSFCIVINCMRLAVTSTTLWYIDLIIAYYKRPSFKLFVEVQNCWNNLLHHPFWIALHLILFYEFSNQKLFSVIKPKKNERLQANWNEAWYAIIYDCWE